MSDATVQTYKRPIYRCYVDEVGNSGMHADTQANERYLSLTGVAIHLDYVQNMIHPQMEGLKQRYFGSHPDEPTVLHRKELSQRKYPFGVLRDPEVEERFNKEILALLQNWEYAVFTIVLDKLALQETYTVWRYDPYHYCLHIIMERYTLWLEKQDSIGDMMTESREGREDKRLKESYERAYNNGTSYVDSARFGAYLSSCQLKIKPKSSNIAGLQLADLLAHPSCKSTQNRHSNHALPPNFGNRIALILEESKYDRSPQGHIWGWGRKWLP